MKQVVSRTGQDRGSALLIAMMVMGVAMSLTILIVSVAIDTGRTTGSDRKRLAAINAAEAGVDAAYASIQGSGLLLPCAWPNFGGQDVKTTPDTTGSSATITYTGESGAVGCPLATGDDPVSAVIVGTGTSGTTSTQRRKMSALVNVKPVPGDGLEMGMFGDRGVSLSNSATVSGTPGQRPDVYTNGDFYCDNSPTFQGSILAPAGKITMKQTCSVTGDVWARDAVLLEGNKTIGGRVLSAERGIKADGNTGVNGTLMAKQNIEWTQCTLSGKCLSNQGAVPAPPTTPFPELRGDATTLAAWSAPAPGPAFEVLAIPASTCGVAAGDWLKARTGALTRNTLYTTACNVEFRNTKQTRFSADVAIFAYGGVSTSNQVSLESTSGTTHNVYFVQPYEAATRPCPKVGSYPVMGPTQQFSSSAQISLLWYSPCDISYGNLGGSYGQVYSGSTLTTNNSYTLTVRKLPIYGLSNVLPSTRSYAVDVVYKRETR